VVSFKHFRSSDTACQAQHVAHNRHTDWHNSDNAHMQTVGQRIRAARELAGYARQGDFAKAIGCSQSTLSEIENGDTKLPSAKVLQKMAEVLGKSERWIIYGEDGDIQTPTQEEHDILSALRGLSPEVRKSLADTIKALEKKS